MWGSAHATHKTNSYINLHRQFCLPRRELVSLQQGKIPLVYEGVEAGENKQRHHGAQRHHVVKLGLQHVAGVPAVQSRVRRLIGGQVGGWVL